MKKTALFLVLFISVSSMFAQYLIGHRTFTFNDPSRTGGFGSGGGPGRQIQTEIYYPATAAGDNTPFVTDSFPYIVFGHGFVMTWDAYMNFVNELVPKGYIILFPRTEGSITPNHNDFGLDLALVVNSFRNLGQNPSSVYYQRVGSTCAIMGHSMGGGAAFLAAANNNNITALATVAAAETNPSAINAAKNVKVPTLVMYGGNDCVTPPINHQLKMYDSLGTKCKTLINIVGGSHCQFAESNFNCNFGETTCSPGPTISRAVQHQRMFKYLVPWLNKVLKGACHPQSKIDSLLQVSNNSEITWQQSCIPQAGLDATVCAGQSLQLGSTLMFGYQFSWTSNPAGFTSSLATPVVQPTQSRYYYLTYTNQYSQCVRQDTVYVQVIQPPVANAGPNTGTCVGNTVQIGTPAVSGVTYQWSPTQFLSNAAIANPTLSTNNAGIYTYIVTATQNGCSSKDTVIVTISPSFSVQATQSGSPVCVGGSVQLNTQVAPFMPTAKPSTSTLPINIPDNTPTGGLQTGNNLPTIAQLNNTSLARAEVNLPHNNFILQGVRFSINHTYCSDLDIYLRTPNDQVFVISTDNGGSNDNYVNVTFVDSALNLPPTTAAIQSNGYYRPEGNLFSTYTGPMQGLWRLYVVDDATGDAGQITAFSLLVLEVPAGLTYSWTPSSGLNSPSLSNPQANPLNTTTYQVIVSNAGCTATSQTQVVVHPLPVVNAGNDAIICTGESIAIGQSPLANHTYQWFSLPSGFTSSVANPTVSPVINTAYILQATDNSTGCSNSDTVFITVTNQPLVVITPGGSTTFCQGGSVQLQATSGFQNYTWSNGVSGTNTITVTTSGTYTVIASNSPTCIGTSSPIFVTVNIPILPNIQTNTTYICQGDSAMLQVANNANFTAFSWNPSGQTTPIIYTTQGGTYQVTTTDVNGCTALSAPITITVNIPQVPVITQSGNILTSTSAASYQWYWNGSPVLGATAQSFMVTQPGNYFVTTIDNNGCEASSNIITISNTTGFETSDFTSVSLYPNPTYESFNISAEISSKPMQIEIFDMHGRMIYQAFYVTSPMVISCADWTSGVYVVKLQINDNEQILRLVKK
ncbi:MAG: T9SS type A sorting domain-containing protein [Flavobacteriales bacterium]|nr:T9SS type A sorting domain-containing protein [Flavobacteriales bacterium]